MLKITVIISLIFAISCTKQAVKGIAVRAISVKKNKFKKITSIKKEILLSRPRNYLVHLEVVGTDSFDKKLKIDYCVCIRKNEQVRNMFPTRVDECPMHKLEKYKGLCKYPNDIDREIAHKLGIPLERDLYELSLKGDLKEIERILKITEVDIDRKFQSGNFNYYSIFHGAVKNSHMHIVDFLIERKANMNVGDHKDNTPLNSSGITLKIAMKLVQKGAGLDLINNHNETPIFRAVREGRKILAMLYAEAGAKLNLKNEYKENILNILFGAFFKSKIDKNDFFELLDYFVKAGVDLNNKSTHLLRDNDYPIILAVRNRNVELVEKLIDYKVNLNLKSNQEFTPLMIALVRGYHPIAKLLIDKGADVNLSGKNALGPMNLAIKDLDMVTYLISKGFMLSEWNIDEFITAAKNQKAVSVVGLLEEKKREIEQKKAEELIKKEAANSALEMKEKDSVEDEKSDKDDVEEVENL